MIISIIHESFHGYTNATLSKGNRAYHSSLIIGTQDRLLGMPSVESNVPTFSRLSHVDMEINGEKHEINKECETRLKNHMSNLPYVFHVLLQTKLSTEKINWYLDRLKKKSDDVIDRALQIAATDWYFCDVLRMLGFHCAEEDIANYFECVLLRAEKEIFTS